MKKYMFTLLVACFALSLGSCSKDNENCDPDDDESPCYVGPSAGDKLLLIAEKRNGKTELEFEYDDQNRLVVKQIFPSDGSSAIISQHISYNSAGLIIAIDNRRAAEHIYREEYSYGSNGKPVSGVWLYPDDDITVYLTYTYTKNTVMETTTDTEGTVTGHNSYSFDENGNPLLISISLGQHASTVHEYGNYDNKPYRYTNYPWSWKLRSVNNAQNHKITAHSTDGATLIVDQLWKYTYNDAGYPIHAEIYDSGSDKVVETREFIYKAAK